MNKPLLAVKDRALDSFNAPFMQQTIAQGVRGFKDEINSDPERSNIAKHPDDYDLYHLGDYDEHEGKITPLQPALVVRGKDLVGQ